MPNYVVTYLRKIVTEYTAESIEQAAAMAKRQVALFPHGDCIVASIFVEGYVPQPEPANPSKAEERAHGMLKNIKRLTDPTDKGAA